METFFNILSNLLSVIAIAIAVASYRHSRAKSKADLSTLIVEKEAELSAINSIYFLGISAFQYRKGREQAEVRKMELEKELAYLKSSVK